MSWDALTGARFLPRRHQILLKSGWNTALVLYCPPGLYDTIARRVSGHLKHIRPDEAKPGTPSLARLVMQTIAVILACIPLVLLPYPFEADIFAAIWLLLCGGVSIWLEPRIAYAVLLGVVAAVARVGWVFLFEDVNLRMGGYGSLNSWGAQMALVVLGLAYLTWFAVSTLLRRAAR